MSSNKYRELEENMKLRNKLLSLGIGCSIIGPTGSQGPTGPQGVQGPTGPSAISSTDGIFSTGFNDSDIVGKMTFDNLWIIPSESEFFNQISDSELEIKPGIYEITMSGLINKADDTHGAEVYLQNSEGSAIKDLSFELSIGNGKQMYFSQTTFFRFEVETVLQVMTNILGDIGTSNVVISDVNLILKKIHE